ncbi:hypothetical protein AB0B66_18850 [Catellatospora sp. NPDC049111]|uniref:hypothetical protein n=1 Tax=Catellatospora sp. NPDC049111 TaxID=3155271 RepID=UPI0033D17301
MLLAESPNITDWLQAVGSIMGSCVAVPAAAFAGLLLMHERKVRREEESDQEAAQARLVIGRITNVTFSRGLSSSGRPTYSVSWSVHNFSGQPAMFVNVVVHDQVDGEDYLHHNLWDLLDPAGKVGGEAIVTLADDGDGEVEQSRFRVDLMYTDAAGSTWRRAGDQQPRRLRQHPERGWIKENPPPKGAWGWAVERIRGPRLQAYEAREDGQDPFHLRDE